MNPISAADNHSILSANARWRLLYNEKPLAEASSRGFRYGARFGSSRRLNESGLLENTDILQVVLGWQQADESWHLGLILAPHIAEERGSRWCELVSWPDPEIHVFQDLAQAAGQELAQALAIPFYVIPPQALEPAMPPPPLPALPLAMGDWTMVDSSDKGVLLLQRSKGWEYRKIGRVLWYALCAMVFVVVSIASLRSKIALPNTGTLLPNPHVLPYLGLAIAVFLVGLMAYHWWLYLSEANEIRIDSHEGTVSAWKDGKRRWLMSATEIQSVYVSKLFHGQNTRSRRYDYAELNLHLGSGQFQFLLHEREMQRQGKSEVFQQSSSTARKEGIYELSRREIESEIAAVALYLGEALGNLPVWLDLRSKSSWV